MFGYKPGGVTGRDLVYFCLIYLAFIGSCGYVCYRLLTGF